ncbi:MAG: hypothetical protein HYY23_18130 [Verrucomicrobia bacterium]|nr:hypothetical protein [Verrucomicrobiota bacterium]
MQVSSTSNTSPANISLELQAAKSRSKNDLPVAAVGPRTEAQEYLPQARVPARAPAVNLDAGSEKKLGRIKEVQVAFKAALNMANSIEDQYLLEPII